MCSGASSVQKSGAVQEAALRVTSLRGIVLIVDFLRVPLLLSHANLSPWSTLTY